MSEGTFVGVAAAYYATVSILVVYLFFAIQRWVEKVQTYIGKAEMSIQETPAGDIRRRIVSGELRRVVRVFPIFSTSVVLLFMISLIVVLSWISGLDDRLDALIIGPLLALVIVGFTFLITVFVSVRREIERVLDSLGR